MSTNTTDDKLTDPKCILGHTLTKQYASSNTTSIQCTECEELISNKEKYWRCGCCSYPYDLCVKCCYDTFKKKPHNINDNKEEELDLDSTKYGMEILTQNMDRSETETLTSIDTDYLSTEQDTAIMRSGNNNINTRMGEQNGRTPLSVYLGLFPSNEKIQRGLKASLRFYHNPARSILYPNTKTMQFPDGKGATKVYVPQQSKIKIPLQEYDLELSQDSDDKYITMSQYQYCQEQDITMSQK